MLASKDQIKADRLRMNNPYAHLDEDGGFSALLPVYVDNAEILVSGLALCPDI